MVNFRLIGNLSFHIAKTGRKRMVTSDTMLIAEVARIDAYVEMHVPGKWGLEILALGEQAPMKDAVIAR